MCIHLCLYYVHLTPSKCKYSNGSKFTDMQVWAMRAGPDETASRGAFFAIPSNPFEA